MKVVAKKLKEKKRNEIEEIKEIATIYPIVHVVVNSDIPNNSIQQIRNTVKGRVLFVKKSLFQHKYPAFKFDENYFLVLASENIQKSIESTEFPDYLKTGEVSTETVVIPAGVVKDEGMAELLTETVMQGGNTVLLKDEVVCKEGEIVNEKGARILRKLKRRLGKSTLKVIAVKELEALD
ncbi:mRNA turnover protein 4 [Pancytospora epiphaga]|nr:mRNA turnover protein 4 [Pancytospora epiphaga]